MMNDWCYCLYVYRADGTAWVSQAYRRRWSASRNRGWFRRRGYKCEIVALQA
jgi:hypothetical protein